MKKTKYIKRQDSGFKLSYGNSGETSLNLSNDIFDFISKGNLKPGEEQDITFQIYKEDCVKAMSFIIMKLPLYKSSSNYSNKVDNYLSTFDELYSKINSFFGNNSTTKYRISLYYRTDGRIYLKGLRVNGFSIRDYLVENFSALQFDDEGGGLFNLRILSNVEDYGETEDYEDNPLFDRVILPHQQIFYGAPGTGKSNTIKREVDEKGKKCFRTTFHPDSDYSTFVGCYKPSMKPTGVTLASKEKEEVITYKFIPQAFTRAYVEAWSTDEDVYLVIEEINRGNCAQIFGDLFQLLDRKDGVSEYPVEADTDLAAYLLEALAKSEREDIPEKVKSGEKLMLPSNLYIWATMNTSDQSLFPIDSAFKRRWDWKYIPIDTRKEQWNIVAEEANYSWSSFLEIVNERVFKATSSEDKQLGFYFCKADERKISAEKFVSKVLFYLWNDVFKDYEEGESIFRDTTGALLPFSKFYHTYGSVNNAVVKELLTALDVETTTGTDTNDNPISETEEEDDDGNTTASAGKNYDKFSVNGEGKYGKNRLATESVRKYIELHPELTAEEVLRNWKNLRVNVPHFIESKEEYESRTDNSIRSYSIPCGDTIIYVAHNGYGSNGKVYELISAVNAQDWGLTLAKVAK